MSCASRAIFAARRCLSLTWGLNRKRLIIIYRVSIEPIVLCCCSVVATAAQRKKLKQKLRGTQRKMAQLITRTFRSSSTEALLVLSGLAPIDSRIQEIEAIRSLEFSNQPFGPPSKAVANRLPLKSPPAQDIERTTPSHFQDRPLWGEGLAHKIKRVPKTPILPLSPEEPGTVRICTDGSVLSNNQVGYAVVVVGPVTTIQKALSPGSTIFQAESMALLEALRWLVILGRSYQSGEIYSDSNASKSHSNASRVQSGAKRPRNEDRVPLDFKPR
jgi:hypothetical protein